jgi:hypothetical protein
LFNTGPAACHRLCIRAETEAAAARDGGKMETTGENFVGGAPSSAIIIIKTHR